MKRTTEIKTLRAALAWEIKDRRVNQQEAAKDIGVSQSTLCRFLQGQGIRYESIIPIAQWCDLTPVELWDLMAEESK